MSIEHTSVAPTRLDEVHRHTGLALRELRSTTTAGALSFELAKCWRAHLGSLERALLLTTAAHAVDSADLTELGSALERLRIWATHGKPNVVIHEHGPDWDEPWRPTFYGKLG